MSYKVTINIYYNTAEHFFFENADEAMQFLRLAAEHLGPQKEDKKTEIMLEVINEEAVCSS